MNTLLQSSRQLLGLAALLSLLAAGAPAGAGTLAADLKDRLEAGQPDEPIPVIVVLGDRVPRDTLARVGGKSGRAELIQALRTKAAQTQPPVIAQMQAQGGRDITPLWAINAIAARLPAAAIRGLERHPAVERIRLDVEVMAPEATLAEAATPEWNLNAIHAPDLWAQGMDGTGVVVASMDTGVDAAHPDLAPRWRGGSNSWYDPNGQHATPYDKTGHGTQAMGLIVGGSEGGSAIGVAPGSQWIAVKIFNDAGRSKLSVIHQGFQWLLDPDGNAASDDAPDVVNNSWGLNGTDQCSLEFQADIQVLKAAGIAVVFAAGNDGPSGYTSTSPANNPEGYAVGATDETHTVASFSSRGPSSCDGTTYPELVAPGVSVHSSDLSFGGLPLYVDVSGTSFAAPHVSGVMALLIQAHPDADVADLEAALAQTALDLGPEGPDHGYGHGLLDAVAASDHLAGQPAPENSAPTAANDAYSVPVGTTLTVAAPGVLGNDSDADGDTLSAQLESTTSGGNLVMNPDGSFSYTPASGTSADSFTYRASDGSLTSTIANVSISVAATNQPPVAADDSALTRRDTPITIAVLANDSDADGSLDPASVAIVAKPSRGGKVTPNPDGSVSYTPKRRFSGTETFGYTVQDNLGTPSNTATVTVQVER